MQINKQAVNGIKATSRRMSHTFFGCAVAILLLSFLFPSTLGAMFAAILFLSASMARLCGLAAVLSMNAVAMLFSTKICNKQLIIPVDFPRLIYSSFFPQIPNIPPRSAR